MKKDYNELDVVELVDNFTQNYLDTKRKLCELEKKYKIMTLEKARLTKKINSITRKNPEVPMYENNCNS